MLQELKDQISKLLSETKEFDLCTTTDSLKDWSNTLFSRVNKLIMDFMNRPEPPLPSKIEQMPQQTDKIRRTELWAQIP